MPPRPPPAPEIDDARAEHEDTLRCLPPDDPGRLFRASLICKAWRSLVTDSGFADRYREFHRTPPLLGFFENDDDVRVWFEPSSPTSPFPPLPPDHRELVVLDCRHGLVLLRYPVLEWDEPAERLIVWDPVGRRQWEFPPPEFAADITYDNAVVLCAADLCDHLGCHGRPFRVAYVGTDPSLAKASVFSSETREWSPVADCTPPEPNIELEIEAYQPKVLVGNVLYFNCGSMILGFDYIRGELSLIQGPVGYYVLMKTKEDVLGSATMKESEFRLWSRQTVTDGSVAWMQRRVVKLEEQISRGRDISDVIDIVDGIGVFYLSTKRGILTIDLQSGGVKNINPIRGYSIIPYMSFYTPDQARAITLTSTMSSSSEGNGEEWGVWEEVGDGEKEGEQQEEEAAQEHFANGSKAFEDGDFVRAVNCLRSSLKIRVVHHGKLSPKCRDTYYRYGWALLRKAQFSLDDSTIQYNSDLDLAWKMLHVARAILEKSPGSTREKVKTFAALAKVSMQREERDYPFIACSKALDILANLVDQPNHRLPNHYFIINLNIQICFTFEFPESGDGIAISLCRSRIQSLERVNVAFSAELGLEEPSLAKDTQFVTNILLSALEEKLDDLE